MNVEEISQKRGLSREQSIKQNKTTAIQKKNKQNNSYHKTSINNKARFILLTNTKRSLTSHGCFCSKYFTGVEHNSTDTNYLLQICDVKICITFRLKVLSIDEIPIESYRIYIGFL